MQYSKKFQKMGLKELKMNTVNWQKELKQVAAKISISMQLDKKEKKAVAKVIGEAAADGIDARNEAEVLAVTTAYVTHVARLIFETASYQPQPLPQATYLLQEKLSSLTLMTAVLILADLFELEEIPLLGKVKNGALIPDEVQIKAWGNAQKTDKIPTVDPGPSAVKRLPRDPDGCYDTNPT